MKDERVEIYHYKDGNEWMPIFFNGNKEVGKLWNKMCQKLMLINRYPTITDYEDFIIENTPKYFQPK